jgi:hypothetical protein
MIPACAGMTSVRVVYQAYACAAVRAIEKILVIKNHHVDNR